MKEGSNIVNVQENLTWRAEFQMHGKNIPPFLNKKRCDMENYLCLKTTGIQKKGKRYNLYYHVNYMFIKKSRLLKTLSYKQRYYEYFISRKTGLKLKIITDYKKRK
ncbi:hypothetical protein AT267_10085 [Bacillus cereus]|nr:hypothetical protein AT267_10085 [Bacillus cereus]